MTGILPSWPSSLVMGAPVRRSRTWTESPHASSMSLTSKQSQVEVVKVEEEEDQNSVATNIASKRMDHSILGRDQTDKKDGSIVVHTTWIGPVRQTAGTVRQRKARSSINRVRSRCARLVSLWIPVFDCSL